MAELKDINWPDLSEIAHVKGRTATEEDINEGRAAFRLPSEGGEIRGYPLDLEIPKYALRGKRRLGINFFSQTADGTRLSLSSLNVQETDKSQWNQLLHDHDSFESADSSSTAPARCIALQNQSASIDWSESILFFL